MLEAFASKQVLIALGAAGFPILGICIGFLIAVIYFKFKSVKDRLSKSETKSDQIMAELKKHVSECNKKGLEAAKIRGEMQAQLQRIEGFLEGLFKGKK